MKSYFEKAIGEYHNGFEREIQCRKEFVEKCYENGIEKHIVFIDFLLIKKTYAASGHEGTETIS